MREYTIWRDQPIDHPYVAKLLKQWDDMLDRKRELNRKK
jgi:hypothetical protein